jgi:hypothetical protein
LVAAAAIQVALYNYCRIHGSLEYSPAIASGVVDWLWSMDDRYAAVSERAAGKQAKANGSAGFSD